MSKIEYPKAGNSDEDLIYGITEELDIAKINSASINEDEQQKIDEYSDTKVIPFFSNLSNI